MFTAIDKKLINIEELSWNEARKLLLPINPSLVEVIDAVSPDSRYKLYKASYPFGAKIITKSQAFLPLADGKMISFNDPNLPKNLKKSLSFNPTTGNPVGVVLGKNSECYLSVLGRILPYSIMDPGHVFGLARALDILEINSNKKVHVSFYMWELTSGVRSIFMLPKITENGSHARLKKTYNLTCDKPESLDNHWSVFKTLAERQNSPWRSSFLYFSNEWFENLLDPAWAQLYNYFLRNNRSSYEFWRNILSWQITFNLLEQLKNIRFSTYTLDNAKHLFAIAAGSLLGFRPAINEDSAPINLIQEAYIKGYELLEYWPVIMEPSYFNPSNNYPVYYSLNYPTLIQSDPRAYKGNSIITLLDELISVIGKYKDGISHDQLAAATSLYKTAQEIEFSFYHPDPARHELIKDASYLAKEDERFKMAKRIGIFPKYGPFVKGCIKIAPA